MADTPVVSAPPSEDTPAPKEGFVQRMLDGIERVGNKVPHPAIIFLGLCVLVIVLSAVLAAFDVHATYDVVEGPGVAADTEYLGGSVVPEIVAPPKDYAAPDLEVRQETTEVKSLLNTEGVASCSRRSCRTSTASA